MAHLVTFDGDRLAPSVTVSVSRAKGHTHPADVSLLRALLSMVYGAPIHPPLPPGARRAISPGIKFTPETDVFLRWHQKAVTPGQKPDGIASPLPLGSTHDQITTVGYTIFNLFWRAATFKPENENTVIDALTTFPLLGGLRSVILGNPDASRTETGPAGSPGSEAGSGSGPTTN
jgi:hypothetical protein